MVIFPFSSFPPVSTFCSWKNVWLYPESTWATGSWPFTSTGIVSFPGLFPPDPILSCPHLPEITLHVVAKPVSLFPKGVTDYQVWALSSNGFVFFLNFTGLLLLCWHGAGKVFKVMGLMSSGNLIHGH